MSACPTESNLKRMVQIGERRCRRNRQYPCHGVVANVIGIEMELENVIHALTGRLVRAQSSVWQVLEQ